MGERVLGCCEGRGRVACGTLAEKSMKAEAGFLGMFGSFLTLAAAARDSADFI
jgi:hypothetical protein